MNEDQFDRIARRLSGAFTRRGVVAGIGGVLLTRATFASAASQIETAACGEAGAVCTQVKGCCSGLVCATSTINTTYGVCVAGEGEMLPVSDDIVVPGAEGITDELAQEVTDASADATDAESALDARATEMQSRQDARRTRIQTHRAKVRSRKDSHRLNSGTNDYTDYLDRLDAMPRLELMFSLDKDGAEVLVVDNLDSDAVLIERVKSLQNSAISTNPAATVSTNTTYLLNSKTWHGNDICPGSQPSANGVEVTVRQSGATWSHPIAVHCGETVATKRRDEATSQSAKKTKRTTPRSQKQSKRGKGH